MEVNFKNYPSLAMKTANRLKSDLEDSTHMALGIMGELGELFKAIDNEDLKNIREESGDVMWFIGVESILRGFDFQEMVDEAYTRLGSYDESIKYRGFDYGDMVKKSFAYGREYNTDYCKNALIDTIGSIIYLTYWRGETFTLLDLLNININKLRTRFGEKFTSEKALNRDLVEEEKTFGEG